MGHHEDPGAWEEAVRAIDSDTYVLVVRDENAVLIFYQHIDPFDEIEADDAEELMNGYAQQILEYLHK